MPGTNAGTGYPLTLRCAKCKGIDNGRGYRLSATGRIRSLASSQLGRGNPRALFYRAEYICLGCGHTGWSRHASMERYLRHTGFQVPEQKGLKLLSSSSRLRGILLLGPEQDKT